MLLLKYVTLIIFKFGKDILMKKELKRFTFKPVALQYLNDNDGFFYANLQESVNELCQILDLKKKPYIYIYPRNINLYDGTRGLHITKKYTPIIIFVFLLLTRFFSHFHFFLIKVEKRIEIFCPPFLFFAAKTKKNCSFFRFPP
mgnify:CR=1 FL=1